MNARKKINCILQLLLVFCGVIEGIAQKPALPGKIGDYKIQQAKILIIKRNDKIAEGAEKAYDAVVKIGMLQNFTLSTSGATFEVPIFFYSSRSGRIDAITFEDLRVNGIKMSVEEFRRTVPFKKGEDTELPAPLRVNVGIMQNPVGVLRHNPWFDQFEVIGTVRVFGTFKKFGFSFKRVIPTKFKFKQTFDIPWKL
jgi:hypothetical protein